MVGERIERLNELVSRTAVAELKSPSLRESNFEKAHSYLEKMDFSQGADSEGVMNLRYLMEFSKLLDKPATKENREEYNKYRGKSVYELYKALYSHSLLLALEMGGQRVDPEKFDASKVKKDVEVKARLMTEDFINDLNKVINEISSSKTGEGKVSGVINEFTKAAGNLYGDRSERRANQAMQATLYDFNLQKVGKYLKTQEDLKKAQGAEYPDEQKIKKLQLELEKDREHIEKVPGIAGLSGIKPFPEKNISPVGVDEKGTTALFARLNSSGMFGGKAQDEDRKTIWAYKQYIKQISDRTLRFAEGHAEFIHPKNEYDHLYLVPMFASYHEVPEHISRNVAASDLASAKAYYLMPGKGGKVRILGVYLAEKEKGQLVHQPSFNHFLLTRMLASMVKGIL